jgi:hypothetical protein
LQESGSRNLLDTSGAPWIRDVLYWMEIRRKSPLFCDIDDSSDDTEVRCFAHYAAISNITVIDCSTQINPDQTSMDDQRLYEIEEKTCSFAPFLSNHLTYNFAPYSPFDKAMFSSTLSPQHAVTNQLMHIV